MISSCRIHHLIDYFSIALTHGLILVAAWRLLFRDDLDVENPDAVKPERPWLKKPEDEPSDA